MNCMSNLPCHQKRLHLVLRSHVAAVAILWPACSYAASDLEAQSARKKPYAVQASPKPVPDAMTSTATETVTVSATRRRQSTHDVANSVTVLTGKDLKKLNAQSYKDYIMQIPGATFNASTPGTSSIAFRGISTSGGTDQGQGTTGYFLNDIPLSEPGFSIAIPDIDTFDVARIEALKGPQSTLFGSATLGGAIDYVPNEANSKKWDAAAESSIVGMPGHEVGYGEKGMVNIPVIKGKLAIRGVLDYRQDPGYITNVGIGKNTNTTYTRNARASVVFTPVDGTKLAYSYLGQNTSVSDDPYSMYSVYGAYRKAPGSIEPVRTQVQMHELRLDQNLHFATLTVMGAFLRKGQNADHDYTRVYGAYFPGLDSRTTVPVKGDSKAMYYEARLTSNGKGPFSWLIGAAYYETWKSVNNSVVTPGIEQYLGSLYGSGIASALVPDGSTWEPYRVKYDGIEKSIFGEFSYRFLHDFTVTGGARVFNMSETSSSAVGGYASYLSYGTTYHHESGHSSQTSALPKFAFKYEPNRQIMAYFQLSEGYRFGAPNTNPISAVYKTPSETRSDSLINYEVGARLNLLHSHLILEPTLYYIDWSNLQARLIRPDGISYGANVGAAVSRGFEFTGTWVTPVPGLSFRANATYTDAHLTQTVNAGAGNILQKGTQLAASPKWQFSETLAYQLVNVPLKPVFSVVHHYQGGAPAQLGYSFRMGDYNTVDLNASTSFKTSVGTAGVSLYVKNLNNSHGISMGYYGGGGIMDQYFLVPPRLVGMTLSWQL